jgi:L,D-transpeptidase YbiS
MVALDKITAPYIWVSIAQQRLWLRDVATCLLEAPVSTALKGVGERNGSGCTPRGWHTIRAKIGAGAACGAVFRGRRPTGEIYSLSLREAQPDRDWILSRILWLSGLEPGFNRMGEVDTLRRYIYIHGCPDDEPIGMPLSHGCIRMRNVDVMALFDAVSVGTRVHIAEFDDNQGVIL